MTFPCHIRKYRKTLDLTQSELAMLLGLRTQGVVSQIEAGTRKPTTKIALVCCLIFDVPLEELFPARHAELRAELIETAIALQTQLRNEPDRALAHRNLAILISRLTDVSP